MPNLVPPADVCRLALSGTVQTHSRFANTFHLYAAGADVSSPTILASLLSDVVSAFASAEFYDAQSDDCGVNKAQLVGSDGTDLYSVEQDGLSLAGTDTDANINAGTAVVVSWKGAWHYRGGKPRTYLPGLTTGWITDAVTLDSGRTASLLDAAVALLEAISALSGSYGSAVSLGVLLGNSPTSHGTFAPFQDVTVLDRPASQRRRNIPH